MAAGAERAVDDRLPGPRREGRQDLVRKNGDVISLGWQDARQHLLRSLRLAALLAPRGAIPDLQVVEHAGDRDFAADPALFEEPGGNDHAPLLVELDGRRAGEEVALHRPGLLAERVERADASGKDVERRAGIDAETAIEAARDHDLVPELLAQLGRERETVLVVEGVVMFAEEHARRSFHPPGPTLTHNTPPVHP